MNKILLYTALCTTSLTFSSEQSVPSIEIIDMTIIKNGITQFESEQEKSYSHFGADGSCRKYIYNKNQKSFSLFFQKPNNSVWEKIDDMEKRYIAKGYKALENNFNGKPTHIPTLYYMQN